MAIVIWCDDSGGQVQKSQLLRALLMLVLGPAWGARSAETEIRPREVGAESGTPMANILTSTHTAAKLSPSRPPPRPGPSNDAVKVDRLDRKATHIAHGLTLSMIISYNTRATESGRCI